jgi:hypothetical protein
VTADTGQRVPAGGIPRARDAAARIDRNPARVAATAAAKAFRPSDRSMSMWHTPPPALSELAKDVAGGDFMPGEQRPWLETAGRWYGRVAIGWVAACYALAWLGAKPGRFLAACTVIAACAVAVLWP